MKLPRIQPEVAKYVSKEQLHEHNLVKKRQQKKFQHLRDKQLSNQVSETVNASSDASNKWVINRSKRILTKSEISVLKKGTNFAVTTKHVPVVELITVTESAC